MNLLTTFSASPKKQIRLVRDRLLRSKLFILCIELGYIFILFFLVHQFFKAIAFPF